MQGTKAQLLIDKMVMQDCERRTNFGMARVVYHKAYYMSSTLVDHRVLRSVWNCVECSVLPEEK